MPTSPAELSRREFLRLTGAALFPFVVGACGDDAILGGEGSSSGGPGSSSSGAVDPTTGPVDPTTGLAPTSTGSTGAGTSTGDDPTTTTGDPSDTSTGDTGDETTTGEPAACEGELVDFDPDAVPEDPVRFPRAVLAGAMRPTSAVLLSHTDAAEPAVLRVWQPGERAGQVKLVLEVEVAPDAQGGLRHLAGGLCPGQWFRYGFFFGDGDAWTGRSLLGEFRTALADGAREPLTVAISACNGLGNRPWPALLTAADEYYDVFLHLGDLAYNDGAVELDDYRASWRAYLLATQDGEPSGLAQAFARAGLYATLDDHEITNNFNPETIDPARLQAALQSYFEAVPLTDEPDTLQVWRSYRWGLTAEFLILDCRTERKPSTANSPDPQYISAAQMTWLKDRLENSPCHFKVVLNSVPITDMPALPWDFQASDRWEGYAAQRFELLDFIAARQIANVWFVAGDFHVCFVGKIQPGADGVLGKMQEVAVTGGNTNVLGDFLPADQYAFGSSQPHALLMTFDPDADEVLVRFIDEDGQDAYAETLTQA
jgi:alkaline phosphatase D